MTRFSDLHAYPAMVPDALATGLASVFVRPGDRVLDPFCGSGRLLLAAAERGADCLGLDVNPLAVLLVAAKCTWVDARLIELTLQKLKSANLHSDKKSTFDLESGRKVRWFSPQTTDEICEILDFLNDRLPDTSLLPLAASVLSATIRDVSYCRKDQWKLHRMSAEERRRWRKSAWWAFRDRFHAALQELAGYKPLPGDCFAMRHNARDLSAALAARGKPKMFDLVITSPPYGDSQTTVQYGGMSGLSIGVLRHVKALGLGVTPGRDIDRQCLGGDITADEAEGSELFLVNRYWHGGRYNRARSRVTAFARDLEHCINQVGSALRKGGLAVFVVARRSAGGWRVYLDRLLVTFMHNAGMRLISSFVRQIPYKVTPFLIHRRARADSAVFTNRDFVPTMRQEFILVFRRV